MRYFTSYLKKVIYYVTRVTCNVSPPPTLIIMYCIVGYRDVYRIGLSYEMHIPTEKKTRA